jgi:F1F0 ATPase subunit 2
MNDPLAIVLATVAGILLGVIFFGGLWWTVREGMSSRRPGIWFLGSLIVRMSVVMLGFFLVGQGDWKRLVACLVGFILARIAVIRWTRSPFQQHAEDGHAA